ncbi:META domain-containing protein [Hymenobacter sp. 102]|uniref:META domain-containing protein n=1 Tax=Hymenobacter sp. 102 TaxID=3403152 RepID=UPI003CF30520
MKLLRLTVPVLAALLSSCAKDNEPMPAPVYLLDQRWKLMELVGQPVSVADANSGTDLLLNSVTGTNGGRAFCNQYGGSYTLTGNSAELTFSPQFSTYATCAMQSQETKYLELLPSVTRYTIRNRQLALYDATHPEPRLVFNAAD